MRVVIGRPPLFDLIDAKFNIAKKGVVFAWGDTIFNPHNVAIPLHMMAHEAVHRDRQGADIEGWWRRYMDDAAFRLAEEIPAHRAEYASFCERHRDRNMRARLLHELAVRLSGELYGKMIAYCNAKVAIR